MGLEGQFPQGLVFRKILNLTVRRSIIRRELTLFIDKPDQKIEQPQLLHLQLNNSQLDWDINKDSLKLGRSDWDIDTSHHNQHSFAPIASRQAQRPAAQEAARSLQPRHHGATAPLLGYCQPSHHGMAGNYRSKLPPATGHAAAVYNASKKGPSLPTLQGSCPICQLWTCQVTIIPSSWSKFPVSSFSGNCGPPLDDCADTKQASLISYIINDMIKDDFIVVGAAAGFVVGFVVAFYFPHLFVFSQKLHPYVYRIC